MSWKDANKPELIALAEAQGVSAEGTRKDLIAAIEASGYEPAAEPEAEAPKDTPKPLRPARLSVNTIWCGNCGTAFVRGANTGDPCPACGTPAVLD